jgi:FtsZ-interacting cell division protein ZipA
LLIRITWGLVLLGLGLVIGGFFTSDSNVLLILAIAVEIAAIILVLASWARRAREATTGADEELTYASDDTDQTQEEELFAALESDEEFAVGGRRPARAATSRPARKPSGSSPARKSTAKAKPSPAARKTAAKSRAKKPAKPKAKAKPKASKPKASGSSRPKATQPRRRPPSASP